MMTIAMTVGLNMQDKDKMKGEIVMGDIKTHIWAQIGKEMVKMAGDIIKMKRLLGFLEFLNNPENIKAG